LRFNFLLYIALLSSSYSNSISVASAKEARLQPLSNAFLNPIVFSSTNNNIIAA
jgi:hypothetical protein